MIVRTHDPGAFVTDGPIAERSTFSAAGDNANVLGHMEILLRQKR